MTVTERSVAAGDRYDLDSKFIFPWRATCEHPNDGWTCSFREVSYTQEAAEWAATHHQHFKTYQESRYNYLSIAEKIWIELDRVINEIKNPSHQIVIDGVVQPNLKLQGRATGLAFAIVQACQPYYADERAVSIMANKRWKMRNGQLDFENTPGFKYDPPIPGARQAPTSGPDDPIRVNQTRRATPSNTGGSAEAQAKKLKPADQDAIKRAMAAGMFRAEDLARPYNTTVEAINWLCKSPV